MIPSHRAGDVPAGEHAFQVSVEPGDDATVVAVSGELDLATVPALRGVLRGSAEHRPARLVIDLSAVTFIDSVGVGAILHATRRVGGGAIAVVLAPGSYAQLIFEAAGVDRVLPVLHTREQATAAVAV